MKQQNAAWLFNLCLVLGIGYGQAASAQADQPLPTTNPAAPQATQFDAEWRFQRGGALGADLVSLGRQQ